MSEERISFAPGALVKARGREWVVLPSADHKDRENLLRLRPLSGSEKDATLIYLPLESEAPKQAVFAPPDPERHKPGSKEAALLLRDALRLKLRAGAGPFRSFGKLDFDPRAYQLAPLLMALKLETVRLLIADDVGIGKTIEAGLIVKELIERGEIEKFTVLCPPHLCEQWKSELEDKFNIRAEVVRTGTVTRLERGLPAGRSIFDDIPFTIVSLDYIKQDRRRDEFLRACPDFVIVDEAHACVRSGAGKTRHRRYELVKKLAEDKNRGMVFLTATPHSGDQQAFSNLLGLLDERFAELAESEGLQKGEERKPLRERLTLHLIQRRRADIEEWKDDNAGFPRRESRETTYRLSGDWSGFFDDVLNYARTIVHRSEKGTDLQKRMSWWAALALLRCASSSPAAAKQALETKLKAPEGKTDMDRVEAADLKGMEMVLDESDDDSLSLSETAPAGDVEDAQSHPQEDISALTSLIERTEKLRGPDRDPKLKRLISEVASLLDDGFQPVIFCRYIATAHYVGEALRDKFKTKAKKKVRVDIITGELTPDQRKERIEALGSARGEGEEESDSSLPLLVATDCLSEGINLQSFFDAAIHYDLAWNPTRHEQREGRVDRFGQRAKTVRTLMLYGENNTVDWAVMRVILRKAEMIRKELGVSVPLPTNNTKVIEAVMEAVLDDRSQLSQSPLFEKTEADVEREWRKSSERHRRTVFAQQSLKPQEVLPEFQKATSALGGEEDVERFVRRCTERLGAPLDERRGYRILPTTHLPKPLQDRLEDAGLPAKPKIAFDGSAPKGTLHIHRAHPLVSTLAEHVVERALDNHTGSAQPPGANEDDPLAGARSGAFFTKGIDKRTVVFLLRLRSQITTRRQKADGSQTTTYLLAEECLGVAIDKDPHGNIQTRTGKDALDLLHKETGRNMEEGQKIHLLRQEIGSLTEKDKIFDRIAEERAKELLADHRRVRAASDARGRYDVKPSKPVDIIGVYVLMPVQG